MKTPLLLRITCVVTCSLLLGCQSNDVDTYNGPAVLVNPDAMVVTQLHHAVSAALGGRHVTLAPDALTNSDLLIIQPAIHRSLQGRLASGRSTGRPAIFHLRLRDSRCVLVHDGSKYSMALKSARCRPFKPGP